MPKQNRKAGIHLHNSWITKTGATTHKTVREWYWILIAKNGKTIAKSSETYKRKRDAVRSIGIAADIFKTYYQYYDHSGNNGIELVEF